MSGWKGLVVSTAVVACGRVGFQITTDTSTQQGSGAPDGSMARPNRVFVTTAEMPGAFGSALAADAMCAAAASSLSPPGTFVAWVSDMSSDAIDRLAGARGWVRVDGAPVADTIAQLLAGEMYNPIDLHEDGARVAPTELAWTGTGSNGRVAMSLECSGWSGLSTSSASAGDPEGAGRYFTQYSTDTCDIPHHLFCFEIGFALPVAPQVSAGRIAFISRGGRATSGIAALDTLCSTDATAASLPGSFVAATATPTASVASRFNMTAPWRRPDGTAITSDAAAFLSGTPPISFVDQYADGRYVAQVGFSGGTSWVGADDPTTAGVAGTTCNNWSSFGAAQSGATGTPSRAAGARFWSMGILVGTTTAPCDGTLPVLCLQQ